MADVITQAVEALFKSYSSVPPGPTVWVRPRCRACNGLGLVRRFRAFQYVTEPCQGCDGVGST